MATTDLEAGLPGSQNVPLRNVPQTGYPALADWIAQEQDSESFIFRKFTRLSARNLLYLQNRVYELEAESDSLDQELLRSDLELRRSARKYETLIGRAAEHPDGPEAKRLSLSREINVALKDYCRSLFHFVGLRSGATDGFR